MHKQNDVVVVVVEGSDFLPIVQLKIFIFHLSRDSSSLISFS